jgi:hypothetical protein
VVSAPEPGKSEPPDPEARSVPAYDAKVLRAFFRDGRLVSIPAQEKKRGAILRYLLDRCFAEDRAYPEREVNERLGEFHEDVAALRRYLVVAGLMTRAGGEYRRAG